jgi:hypothetical protein
MTDRLELWCAQFDITWVPISENVITTLNQAQRGERGIRTLGTVARTTVFETVPFNHSGISPDKGVKIKLLQCTYRSSQK